MRSTGKLAILLVATFLLSGCSNRDPINVMTVYDGSTMECDTARSIARVAENRSVMDQIAGAKVSFCDASTNDEGALPVGYFDAIEKHYEFRTMDVRDADAVHQLCVDLASAAEPARLAPTNYRFATEFGEFSCEQLPIELLDRGAVPMVAPSQVAIHIDVDPVLVHASGANPRLTGMPKYYYDDVREFLAELVAE